MDLIWNERSRVIYINWDNLFRNRPEINMFKSSHTHEGLNTTKMKEFCLLLWFGLLFDPNIFILLFARDKILTYRYVVFHGKNMHTFNSNFEDSKRHFCETGPVPPGVALPFILPYCNLNMFINKITGEKGEKNKRLVH